MKKHKSHKGQTFVLLYRKFAKPLLKFLLKRYNLPLSEAEEIAQETWVAAYKSYHTFENRSKFFTWLCKIAMCRTADYYRKFVNRKSGLISPSLEKLNNLVSSELTPEEEFSLLEVKRNVKRGLRLLPENYKKVLILRYYYDCSYAEIAKELRISVRAVEGRLYRAKKELAVVLARD
ncbi:RNA polymerase sigma factor [Patescibacteria group bacterium]